MDHPLLLIPATSLPCSNGSPSVFTTISWYDFFIFERYIRQHGRQRGLIEVMTK